MAKDVDSWLAEVEGSGPQDPVDKFSQEHAYLVSDLAKDKTFAPESHIAQYAKDDPRLDSAVNLALQVQKQRDEDNSRKSALDRISEMHPVDALGEAVVGTGKSIGKMAAGAVIVPYKTAAVVSQNLGSMAADAVGADDAADYLAKKGITSKAEALQGSQKGFTAASGMIDPVVRTLSPLVDPGAGFQDMSLGGVTSRMVLPQPVQLSHSEIKLANEKHAQEVYRNNLIQKADLIRDQTKLSQGIPLDEGISASVARLSEGGVEPSKAFGPEALKAAGAEPVSQFQTDAMGEMANPAMVAMAAAPALPGASKVAGALTYAAGKTAQLPLAILKGGTKLAGAAVSAAEKSATLAPILETKLGKGVSHAVGFGGAGGIAAGLYTHPLAAAGVLGSAVTGWLGDAAAQQAKERLTGTASALTTAAAEGRATGKLALNSEAKVLAGNAINTGAATAVGMAPLTALNAYDAGNPDELINGTVSAGMFGGAFDLIHSNRPAMVQAIRPMLNDAGKSSIDASSYWGKKSAGYIESLPDDQKSRTLETMGAFNRIPGVNADGETHATKIVPLSGADYAEAVKAHTQDGAADGGQGFFFGKNGTAFINGESSDLAHTIGHEAGGHAAINVLRAMSTRDASGKAGPLVEGLMNTAKRSLMNGDKPTPEFQKFIDGYNQSLDPTGKTKALDSSDPRAIEEFIAEQAGQIISGEGAANIVLPKTLLDKVTNSVGGFAARMLGLDPRKVGTETEFGREEVGKLTSTLRDTLSDIAGSKFRDGNVDMTMGDRSTEVLPAKPAAKLSASAPVSEPAPANTFESRLEGVGVSPEVHDAARDYHIGDIEQIQPVRANSKKGLPGKSRDTVIAEREKEWDDMLSDLVDHAEHIGANLPNNPTELHQAAIRHALSKDYTPSVFSAETGLPARQSEPAVKDSLPTEPAPTTEESSAVQPLAIFGKNEDTKIDAEPAPAKPLEALSKPKPIEQIKQDADAAEKAAEEAVKASPEFAKKRKDSTRQKAVEEAKTMARTTTVLDAVTDHARATGSDALLQRREDGSLPYYAGRIDPSIPSHRALLDELNIPSSTEGTIRDLSSSIGKMVFFKYKSPPKETAGDNTGKQRSKEMRLSTVDDRLDGGDGIAQDKAFVPVSFRVSPKSGSILISGFHPESLLLNVQKIISHLRSIGESTGYVSAGDPQFMEDVQGYAMNHANGWRGDGRAQIAGETPTEGYKPYPIDSTRFDVLNAAFQGKDPIAKGAKGAETKALAELNGRTVDPQTGDTNPLRAFLDKSGQFTFTNENKEVRKGGSEILESVYQSLDPRLFLTKISAEPPSAEERVTIRPTDFDGKLADFNENGRPKQEYVKAAFMPKGKNFGKSKALSSESKKKDARPLSALAPASKDE